MNILHRIVEVTLVELKFVSTGHGEHSVMTFGMMKMQVLLVDSWDFLSMVR